MDLESVKLLEDKEIDYELFELSGKSVTTEEVVKNARKDIKFEEVCKTIIVKSLEDNDYYGVFLKGDDTIDFNKINNVLGKEIETVDLDELRELTGKDPGEICPITLDLPIILDEKVFNTQRINFGSGDSDYGLEIRSNDIKKFDYLLVDNLIEE